MRLLLLCFIYYISLILFSLYIYIIHKTIPYFHALIIIKIYNFQIVIIIFYIVLL